MPFLRLVTLLGSAWLLMSVALGDDGRRGDRHGRDDHERARAALERGEVRPLAWILERVGARLGGEVMEVEFEKDDGRYVYEFEIVTPDGRWREVEVDAKTGRVLERDDD